MRAAKPAILMMALLWWVGAGAGGALGGRSALAANAQAEGRKHARKANHLADTNKCKQAIPEYTKALRLLKDPTLLFNRAECYRRTGEATKAVADYRKFLVDLPNAPNRAQVETQIAALDKRPAPAVTASAAPAAGSKAAAGRTGATKPPAAAAPAREPAATAPVTRPVTPPVAEREPSGTEAGHAAPPPPAPAEHAAPMALVDAQPRPAAAAESEGGSSHWWIWVLGAAVIAGGAAGTYFAIKQGQTDIPASALGNYRF